MPLLLLGAVPLGRRQGDQGALRSDPQLPQDWSPGSHRSPSSSRCRPPPIRWAPPDTQGLPMPQGLRARCFLPSSKRKRPRPSFTAPVLQCLLPSTGLSHQWRLSGLPLCPNHSCGCWQSPLQVDAAPHCCSMFKNTAAPTLPQSPKAFNHT